MCNLGFQGVIHAIVRCSCHIQGELTMKMTAVVYAETLQWLQHMTQPDFKK